ncbi:hypothetical protein HUE87_09840 [Candidatus Sulfurimonas marisnigri]|uniref:Uncharacterized protein n=1 Tax=Candidatus Sulfurimonas marisnigri TaxID=2740405 RepID=A0A7S7RPA6_9BACT|nr:hypothetical protein [Candidatus Sulfurimonas marisnigri]QOY54177.1 hypothetical protein HUE87_09840 [Candidatus Sulfurimonas marisnigri]
MKNRDLIKKLFLTLYLLLYTTVVNAETNSCSPENRLNIYISLEGDTGKLLKSLPSFIPSKKMFFKRVKEEYYNNKKEKYKSIVNSNSFLAYNNSAQLEELQNNVNNIIDGNKRKDLYDEVKFLFALNSSFLFNAVLGTSYMDSEIMFDRKIVDKEYREIAKSLSVHVVDINKCADKMVFELKNIHQNK